LLLAFVHAGLGGKVVVLGAGAAGFAVVEALTGAGLCVGADLAVVVVRGVYLGFVMTSSWFTSVTSWEGFCRVTSASAEKNRAIERLH